MKHFVETSDTVLGLDEDTIYDDFTLERLMYEGVPDIVVVPDAIGYIASKQILQSADAARRQPQLNQPRERQPAYSRFYEERGPMLAHINDVTTQFMGRVVGQRHVWSDLLGGIRHASNDPWPMLGVSSGLGFQMIMNNSHRVIDTEVTVRSEQVIPAAVEPVRLGRRSAHRKQLVEQNWAITEPEFRSNRRSLRSEVVLGRSSVALIAPGSVVQKTIGSNSNVQLAAQFLRMPQRKK